MMWSFQSFAVFLLSSLVSVSAIAHQPVMDMGPRWEGGYGLQIRHESYGSNTLLEGDNEINNPLGIERYIDKTWIEGVYTFDRSKRITFKLPHIQQERTKNIGGQGIRQTNSGMGDLILGFPMKRYFNRGAETGNWSFTPSLRIPTGSYSGDYPLSDGSWDVGLSFSYSSETPYFYQLYDLFYWSNSEGKREMHEGDEFGLDINWGIHPLHDNLTNSGMFLMWDVSALHNNRSNTLTSASEGTFLHTGPVLVLYKESAMFRAEYKFAAYEKIDGVGNSKGDIFQVGIGFAF